VLFEQLDRAARIERRVSHAGVLDVVRQQGTRSVLVIGAAAGGCDFHSKVRVARGPHAGMLDVVRQRVTHIHCPPVAREDDPSRTCVRQWRRHAAWAPAPGPFCVGSQDGAALHLLDFASGAASPCAAGAPGPGPASPGRLCVGVAWQRRRCMCCGRRLAFFSCFAAWLLPWRL